MGTTWKPCMRLAGLLVVVSFGANAKAQEATETRTADPAFDVDAAARQNRRQATRCVLRS
jgi:hypothetical protein